MVPVGKLTNSQTQAILLAVLLVWVLMASLPEVLRDRIFPFDSAQIAANGALFQSMFAEFGAFFAAPVDWLWSYFEQYPALSLRRHPPLFGFVAGIVYSVVGVSAVAAKLTVMLFACIFSIGVFFVARRMFNGFLLASCVALLVVATPEIALHFRSVWLDIPSLAFAIWVFYLYLARLDGNHSIQVVLGMVVFAVLALYTYQPTLMLLAGVFVHLLFNEWRTMYKDRPLLVGAGVLVVLMLPLVIFTAYFAKDSLLATTGVIPAAWKEFDSPEYASWMVRDKMTLDYWTYYAKIIVESYPVQFAGLGLWVVLRLVRKPTVAETLMFVCVVVAYIGFSWLVVKGHRYTLYMMIPASLLTVAAIHDTIYRLMQRSSKAIVCSGLVVLVFAGLQSALVSLHAPYKYLAGIDEPVRQILSDNPVATILYSGRNDAAFVFYTRSLDKRRGATVHRASMQLADPAALATYVQREKIDFIVLEKDNPGYESLEITDQFREAILVYVDQSPEFALQADYRLPYGVFREEGSVLLNVYGRTR